MIKEQTSRGKDGLFKMVGEVTGRVTRANAEPMNIKTTRSRLEIRRNNFSARAVGEWNRLSNEEKCVDNVNIFKNAIVPGKQPIRRPEDGRRDIPRDQNT